MVIIFSNRKVRDFLMKNGTVYTYRKMHPKTPDGVRIRTGKDWATDRRAGKKIMDVVITPIQPITDRRLLSTGHLTILRKYVSESGFTTAIDWLNAIRSLNPRHAVNGWIYKVEKR